MKFRWRIFLVFTAIYIISLVVIGVLITENNYKRMLIREVDRSLEEEINVHDSVHLYLIANQKVLEDQFQIGDYAQRIVDIFKGERTHVQMFNRDGVIMTSSMEASATEEREEVKRLLEGHKNYILRSMGDKHYLFITDRIQVDNDWMIMSYIKDISHVDEQRREQYAFFIRIGLLGFIVITVITGITSKLMVRPIEKLTKSAEDIARGNYGSKVTIENKDEIGMLGEQFNRMSQEIERRMLELKMESDRKQRFMDNLTHELRTPLTSIIGYSDTLLTIKYDKKVFHKSLGYIKSEGERMLKMVNHLMEIILIREDDRQLSKQPIAPLLSEVKDLMIVKALDKKVSIKVKGENLTFPIDRDLMKGVLINLVDNAINASKEGDIITLGTEKKDRERFIYVKDEGKGIHQQNIDKIMEPFYRVDKGRSRKQGGIGLGLSICAEIIKKHRAMLDIESKIGLGTTVKVIFQENQ